MTKKLWYRLVVSAVILPGGLILSVGTPVRANQSGWQVAPGQTIQQPAGQAPIRVGVALAGASVRMSDYRGALVPQLRQDDCCASGDAVKRTIESPGAASVPISVVMVVETSSRVEALLPAIRRTGILLTQNVLGPDGEAALIGYNDEVDRLLDFTSDDGAIEKAIGNIQMGTSGTHLFDALSQAVLLLRARVSSRRRVIVVVAETANTGNEKQLARVIREAQLAHIAIYSVALSSTLAELRDPQAQAAPPSAIPPGIFALPPMPGTPQTPTTEALLRTGNMDLGALALWGIRGTKHANSPLRDNPLETAAAATDGLYQAALRDSSIAPAIDKIGGDLHAQ